MKKLTLSAVALTAMVIGAPAMAQNAAAAMEVARDIAMNAAGDGQYATPFITVASDGGWDPQVIVGDCSLDSSPTMGAGAFGDTLSVVTLASVTRDMVAEAVGVSADMVLPTMLISYDGC